MAATGKGRKKLPSNVKVLKGTAAQNPGRINSDELQYDLPDKAPPTPTTLRTAKAKAEFRRLRDSMMAVKILNVTDIHLLEIYCIQYDIFIRAQAILRKNKSDFIIDDKGNIKSHPATVVSDKAVAQMMRLAPQFGYTPSARASIKSVKVQDEKKPFARERKEKRS